MSTKTSHLRPISNLKDYIRDKSVRMAAGWVNGMVYFNGQYFTEKEFDELFPAKLIYRTIQVDGTQVKTN